MSKRADIFEHNGNYGANFAVSFDNVIFNLSTLTRTLGKNL